MTNGRLGYALRRASLAVTGSPLARSAGIAFGIQVVGVALAYLLHVLLARWMGAEGYGVYSYALAWATLLATAGGLGLPLASLRFLSEYRARGEWALLRGAVRGFPGATLAGGVAVAAVGSAVVALAPGEHAGLWLAMAMVPVLALSAVWTEMARAVGSVVVSLAPSRLLRPLLTLVAVWLAFELIGAPTPVAALAATLGALLLVAMAQQSALSLSLPPVARGERPAYRFGDWFRTGRGLLVASGISLLLTQLDILMVGLLLDERQVGFYSAAAKTAALVSFVLFAINVAAAPKISQLYTQGRQGELQRLASNVAQAAFWPSLALAGGLALLADPILQVFGGEFTAARWDLRVLAMGYLWSAGVGSVGYLLNLTGHERQNARALVEAAVLDLTANVALVPWLGTLGAALSTTLTWVYVGWRLHRLTTRHTGVRASILYAWRGAGKEDSE